MPGAAWRHHSGGRRAPLGFGVSALFFPRLGLLGNLLDGAVSDWPANH